MEGNEKKKCDFSQNGKNKALNTLTNCSKQKYAYNMRQALPVNASVSKIRKA
jgi:hypothetical protein